MAWTFLRRASVVWLLVMLSGVVMAFMLVSWQKGSGCYWASDLVPYVECRSGAFLGTFRMIWHNLFIVPLLGIAFVMAGRFMLFLPFLLLLLTLLGIWTVALWLIAFFRSPLK